jgi:putative protease
MEAAAAYKMEAVAVDKPELVAPAGDREKLEIAAAFGADAVYLGGHSFSLRAGAGNFTDEELRESVAFAHASGIRVYVAANVFARNADFPKIGRYFEFLAEIGADALIISDPGVFGVARRCVPEMPIHISTQANVTNNWAARFWRDLGASRVIVAREMSMAEIKEVSGVELEAFVHGSMCVSYSGRCLLSGVMVGRGANSGECAHPCRYRYAIVEETRPGEYMPVVGRGGGTYVLNSRDLCMIEYLPELIDAGVTSFKIEGRAKSPYYAACAVKAYRGAIDDLFASRELYERGKPGYLAELRKASHRPFFTGFYFGSPGEKGQTDEQYARGAVFAGVVMSYSEDSKTAIVQQRGKFSVGDSVEFLRAKQVNFRQTLESMTDEDGAPIISAPHAKQLVRVKVARPVSRLDIMRVIV